MDKEGDVMKIVVAVDSFKGSLSSLELGECIAQNIKAVDDKIEVVAKGIADGGEGTVKVLSQAMKGQLNTITVHGPYGELEECTYGIADDTIIIEVAEIVGLANHPQKQPLKASSYGIGEVIKHCLNQGYRKFIVGLGGSCTNDGGMGMLEALGANITYQNNQFNPSEILDIDLTGLMPELKQSSFLLASDVTNPLCGPQGATAIFGPQKGVDEKLYPILDQSLNHYSQLISQKIGIDVSNYPGAGAAGGLGFAFLALMKAKMQPGIDLVLEKSKMEMVLKTADLLITGEGCIDGQSAMGKAVSGLCKLAKKHQVPVIGIGGSVKEEAENLHEIGMTAYFSIQMAPHSLQEALTKSLTIKQVAFTTRQIIRFYLNLKNPHKH